MFNTGTVVGVSANIYGGDFPPKFIPSFDWSGKGKGKTFEFEKALEIAERVMQRRNLVMSREEKDILKWIFNDKQS